MRKLFFLTALLCASMMAFATQYCNHELTNEANAIRISCEKKSGDYVVTITASVDIEGLGGSYVTLSDGNHDLREYLSISGDKRTATITMSSSSDPSFYTPLYVLMPGEVSYSWPDDITWGRCGDAKTDPELTITAQPSDSLNADTDETFTIKATRKGDGAITYESANPGIATVGETTGVITAVGRGSTTITVRVAETTTYDGASQKITVKVKGAINWDAISYLTVDGNSSAYTNLYKAYYEGTYPRVINIRKEWTMTESGIYVEYPSAVFNWTKSNVTKDEDCFQQGAGLAIYMNKFTKKTTDITVNVDNTDYTFTVWYKNGGDIPAALDNTEVEAKAIKVIENGQLIIIKNGIRYNALGAQMK